MTSFFDHEFRKSPVQKVVLLAFFIALSSVIQVVENSLFPSSLPIRPGFANAVIILVIAIYGPKEAVLTAAARSALAALVTGKFLAPPFILSISGGVASALVMALLYGRFKDLGVVGVSVIGATVHNFVQLAVIALILVRHAAILNILPWLWTMALATGLAVGFASSALLRLAPLKKLVSQGRNSNNAVKT